jgi:hypothetical protein
MVSVTDPYGRILDFLDKPLLFYQAAPQLQAEWTPLSWQQTIHKYSLAWKYACLLKGKYLIVKKYIFWIITLRSPLNLNGHFEETYVQETNVNQVASTVLFAIFFSLNPSETSASFLWPT